MAGADALAFWTVARGRGELRPASLAPSPGDVTVRTRASGISRGSERLVFEGRVPASQHAAMRAPFQAGELPFPVKYGYAAVGVVEAGPRAGERVFALHPHQDRFVVPDAAALTIPDAVPDARATLAANMETALNGWWDAEAPPGAAVAVIGAGVVGLLAALVAHDAGHRVRLVDPDPARVDLARALGLDAAIVAAGEFEIVLEASGRADGLVDALAIAGFEARIVCLSWYGDAPVALPLGEAFHARRLTLVSSQVGHVARPQRATLTRRARLATALDRLADPRYDRLLAEPVPFRDLPRRMQALLAANATPPHQVVAY